ncbi:MAG: class I SAM-dependent methyltransferase, partial [Thermoplasmata archaeon]
VEMTEARAARAGVSVNLSQGDATQLANHDEFDAVLVIDLIELLPEESDAQKCLGQIHGALRPGGVAVCNVYNPFTTGEHWLTKLLQHRQEVSEEHARGISITEIWRLQRFDPVHGAGWVKATTIVEAPDGRHVFRDRFRFRIQSYWGMTNHLRAAGFREISCYPDWKTKQAKKPKAEQLVFVARK